MKLKLAEEEPELARLIAATPPWGADPLIPGLRFWAHQTRLKS